MIPTVVCHDVSFLLFLLLNLFSQSIITSATTIIFANAATITVNGNEVEAVDRCCPPPYRACCLAAIRSPGRLRCPGWSPRESLRAAACLDRALHNGTIIDQQVYKCCWLLHSDACYERCLESLLTPAKTNEAKLEFTNECQLPPSSTTTTTVTDGGGANTTSRPAPIDCLLDAILYQQAKAEALDQCFSVCQGWHHRQWLQLGRPQLDAPKEHVLVGEETEEGFQPEEHCEIFRDFAWLNPCILPPDVVEQ